MKDLLSKGQKMKVKEIMTSGIETIEYDSTISLAAKRMQLLDVGALPVEQDEELMGMISGRDIITRAIAMDKDPWMTQVHEIMTRGLSCCNEEESVETAVSMMERGQMHRLVVLDYEGNPVGMLTLGDIAVKTGNEHLASELLECVSEPACPRPLR
jgi:predicted transcriptional regulator